MLYSIIVSKISNISKIELAHLLLELCSTNDQCQTIYLIIIANKFVEQNKCWTI